MELHPAPQGGPAIRVRCWPDESSLAAAVAHEVGHFLHRPDRAPRALMLAGGRTPLAAYARLADLETQPDAGLHFFFSDDRLVPPDDTRSNYGNILPCLTDFGMDPAHILRVQGERPLNEAVNHYAAALAAWEQADMPMPLGLLGLGADGHTASLFSPAHIEEAEGRLVLGVQRPDGLPGVSVTPRLLHRVARLLVLVTGASKREAVQQFLRPNSHLASARALRGHPAVEIWTDPAAWPFESSDTLTS